MLTVARTHGKPVPSPAGEPQRSAYGPRAVDARVAPTAIDRAPEPCVPDTFSATEPWMLEVQRCVAEALDLDGSTLFERSDDGDLLATQGWWRPHVAGVALRLSLRESLPWLLERLLEGKVVSVSSAADLPGVDRSSLHRLGLESLFVFPLLADGRVIGAAGFATARRRPWRPDVADRLRLVAEVFEKALARRQADARLRAGLPRAGGRWHAAPSAPPRDTESGFDGSSVGRSAAIRHVLEQVRQAAESDATVLLLGETGSGAEMVAARIHALSRRGAHGLVRVNCAALPATLIESELFGRDKGAYTGALSRQAGRFEQADGSSIFLDEVADLPADVQPKLLRVIEERQVRRLGSSSATSVDARIIAATHHDLEQRVAAGAFQRELFDRLNVFPIRVPPLRERADDIPMLVWRFVAEFSDALGKRIESIPKDTMEALQRYAWPGNLSELRNVVERAVIGACGPGSRLP